jgi:hypothetical protein
MKQSLDFMFQLIFILTEGGTASANLDTFWQQWIVERMEKTKFIEE